MGWQRQTRTLAAALLLGLSAVSATAAAQPSEGRQEVESASEQGTSADGRFSPAVVADAAAESERPPDHRPPPPKRRRGVAGPIVLTSLGFGATVVAGLVGGLLAAGERLSCWGADGYDHCEPADTTALVPVVGFVMAIGLVLGILGAVKLRSPTGRRRASARLDARGLHF